MAIRTKSARLAIAIATASAWKPKVSDTHYTNRKSESLKKQKMEPKSKIVRLSHDGAIFHNIDVGKVLAAVDSVPSVQRIWLYYAYAAPNMNWLSRSEIEDLYLHVWCEYCFMLVKEGENPKSKKFSGVYRSIRYMVENYKFKQNSGKIRYKDADIVREAKLNTKDFNRDYRAEIERIYCILDQLNSPGLQSVHSCLPSAA